MGALQWPANGLVNIQPAGEFTKSGPTSASGRTFCHLHSDVKSSSTLTIRLHDNEPIRPKHGDAIGCSFCSSDAKFSPELHPTSCSSMRLWGADAADAARLDKCKFVQGELLMAAAAVAHGLQAHPDRPFVHMLADLPTKQPLLLATSMARRVCSLRHHISRCKRCRDAPTSQQLRQRIWAARKQARALIRRIAGSAAPGTAPTAACELPQ